MSDKRRRGGYGTGARKGIVNKSRSSPPKESSPDLPLGDLLAEIDPTTITPSQVSPKISDCEYVASYNWLDGPNPTILVPGSPPRWTPPVRRQRLQQDSGDYYRDVNAARYPRYPTEPGVRALLQMQPKLNTTKIDVVGCGNTLGNLLALASGKERSFRFDVDVIGSTMFFVRREKSPKEIIRDIRGYGHTFPESHTQWANDVRGSVSHQRIVKYSFGGLSIVVRSESDGYIDDLVNDNSSVPSKTIGTDSDPYDNLAMSSLLNVSAETVDADEPLTIKSGGQKIPQSAIFDIKTRLSRNIIDMDDVLPRLWVNQTPNFIIAYHNWGEFEDPRIQRMRQNILAWETANAKTLGLFHAIMHEVKTQARNLGLDAFEVTRTDAGLLQLRKQIG